MENCPQELAQDAVCQSHTGHMIGLWFLPAQPLRLNTNERMKGKAIPLHTWTGPEGSWSLRLPDFKTIGTRRW